MSATIDIPEKYKQQLNNLLNQMEDETNNMYQFTINTFGYASNQNCIIGDFKKRNSQIEIYNVEDQYKELVGVYNSRDDIKNKIQSLENNEVFEETKEWVNKQGTKFIIGKCKACHSYNENVLNRFPNIVGSSCQNDNCRRSSFDTKWKNVQLSDFNNMIFVSAGGSMSRCYEIGKWKFVK